MTRTLTVLAALLMLGAQTARADDTRAQIYGQALAYVERSLAGNPDDPQVRMLKGRFLVELGRNEEATELLEKLAAEHPALGEPQQMLALLYAAEDLKDKPSAALQRRLVGILAAKSTR